MRFTKMQACGNDFIVINAFENELENPGAFAEAMCDRHYGIGADGVLLVGPSDKADVRMRIINADGGEVNMCGNGVRCAAKFAYDHGMCGADALLVETGAGVLSISLVIENGECVGASVDMGIPDTDPARYPLLAPTNKVEVRVRDRALNFFCVNTGVPHAVTFDLYPDDRELKELGSAIEHDPLFPKRTNVCFGRVDARDHIDVRVWERGCGVTLACGTGSCAVLYAAHAMGMSDAEADIALPGGTLRDVLRGNGHVIMTGPAKNVFEGEV